MVSLLRRVAVGLGQGITQVGNASLKDEMQKARDARLAANADKQTQQQNQRTDARNAVLDDRYAKDARQSQANFDSTLQAKKNAEANALKISKNNDAAKAENKKNDNRRKTIAIINKRQSGYVADYNKSVEAAKNKLNDSTYTPEQYQSAIKAAQTRRDSNISMLQKTYPTFFTPKPKPNPVLNPTGKPEPSNHVLQSSGNGNTPPVNTGLLSAAAATATTPTPPTAQPTALPTLPAVHGFGRAMGDSINNYQQLRVKLGDSGRQQFRDIINSDNTLPNDVKLNLIFGLPFNQ